MKAGQEKKRPLKSRIIEAAYKLFDEQGIQHVTVDAIAVEAGTTKMGVYRHFSSKELLMDGWMVETIARYRGGLDEIVTRFPGDPQSQLRAWAEFIVCGLDEISHRGCPFVNTIAEISDRKNPLRRKIEAHKALQVKRIATMCRAAGITDPFGTAAEITFLLEGAQVSAQNRSVKTIEKHVRAAIEKILADAGDSKRPYTRQRQSLRTA